MKQKGSILLPTIIIVSFIGVMGYFFYEKSKPLTVIPTTKLTETATDSVSTSPLKEFNGEKYSLTYPTSWDTAVIGENKNSRIVAPKEIVDKIKQMQGGFGGGTFLTLTINTDVEDPIWKTSENWIVTSEPIKIDNISGTKYNISVIQDGPGYSVGDKITSVVVNYKDKYTKIDLLDQKYKDIYDQILSSFEFTK